MKYRIKQPRVISPTMLLRAAMKRHKPLPRSKPGDVIWLDEAAHVVEWRRFSNARPFA